MNENKITGRVEIRDIAPMTVACVNHTGPYKGNSALFAELIGKICSWGGPKGLLKFPDTKLISIYHDNCDVTPEDQLRISVCITVPDTVEVDGEITKMRLEGGRYAVGTFTINGDEYEDAWNYIFSEWMPGSGYRPDYRPFYELYLNDPKMHPEGKHIVEIHIPVAEIK